MPQTIVLATNNRGKVVEFQRLLTDTPYRIKAQAEFDIPDAEETGLSFVENAIIKARHASRLSKLPAIADDSGLEVDLLNGAPGIYSARFAGPAASDADNNHKLLNRLQGLPREQRTARFQCLLVYMRHAEDPTPLICQGSWEGEILTEARGDNGFGYDPLFYIPECGRTSAQLSPEEKSQRSHRAKAMARLLEKLPKP
ncbi:MAG TPA: non-canonical purine NTP pyrophosphatase [Porticoccaceae bacterium]|nr:non-canonical purine NTP pyrophosphatase [Porticoccaceae bacterium]HCO61296.1 non-canonical purine NTP pyrophosphatase [Porticoccaceae bacterium]